MTLGNRRLYISGDTDNTPEVRALTNIDVAFLCMRGPPANMTLSDALVAVRAFHPAVVYPYHYGTVNVDLFKQQLGTEPGIEVRLRPWY